MPLADFRASQRVVEEIRFVAGGALGGSAR
jgi:hypothetical protein